MNLSTLDIIIILLYLLVIIGHRVLDLEESFEEYAVVFFGR